MDRRHQPVITYRIENKNSVSEYVMDFISDFLGIKLIEGKPSEIVDIYYGNATIDCKIKIPYNKDCIIWSNLIKHKVKPQFQLDFDVINAIGYFLTDSGNQIKEPALQLDKHKRLKYKQSFQHLNDIGDFPIVNVYANHLAECIEKFLLVKPLPLYPKGKKACILLTHDVDNPDKYDSIYTYRLLPKKLTFNQFLRHYRFFFGTLKNLIFDKQRNENWNFDKIMEAEKKYDFSSTFFFATKFQQSKTGHLLDVPYDLNKKKYKRLIQKLIKSEHSIGLHASYNAYLSKHQFSEEKINLEKHTHLKIDGLRHHYWHLGRDINQTLLLHEKIGFKYDSSLAFNDHIGFRYNTALPFYPYIKECERAISVLQIPMFCMDGNLFYRENMTTSLALEIIDQYIKTIIKNNGVGAIDWHVNTSYPGGETFKVWGETYLKILDLLNKHSEIWVTNTEKFEEWWTKGRYDEK